MPSFSSGTQRPGPRRLGTITAIDQGIATIALDGGGSTTLHPSSWRNGHTDDAIYRVGDRVQVFGGTEREQCESCWRDE